MLETGDSIDRPRPIASAIRSMLQNEELRSVPLDLRPHLAKLGLTDADRIIIEDLPIGGALTIGQCKAGRSWTVLPHEIDGVGFIAPAEDGRTYTLTVCVIAPDPSDHGLAKTKGQFNLPVTAPLTAAPALPPVAKSESAPAPVPAAQVIQLPAAVAPASVSPQPPAASDVARLASEQETAAAQAAWQEETA
ncbi:MAG TPA: hypothetical protein VMQ73_22270, partial [Methylomirabilota bacterium]|nr:hypothetical protein [Methylomirabilota bacterium]